MMLTIPSCLLLERLRYNKVGDSIIATGFGFIGTVICLVIGLIMGFTPSSASLSNPKTFIPLLVAFTFFGMFFLFLEARLRLRLHKRTALMSSVQSIYLSRARVGVFICSGIWELLKSALPGQFFIPSAFRYA